MPAFKRFNDHPTVVPIDGHQVTALRDQLNALLPRGARLRVFNHPDVDCSSVAFILSLPARPNASLPGRLHPASAPFGIAVSRRLIERHLGHSRSAEQPDSLAQWILVHVIGAAPSAASGAPDMVPPLAWRFTASLNDALDVCAQRVRQASAA